MVLKVFISGMSGNKEVKKRQQRVLMILDSKSIKYELIDITEPGKESEKDFMQTKSLSKGGTVSDPDPKHALPPQIFFDEEYCGDYDGFDLANEIDTLEEFLRLVPPGTKAAAEAAAAEAKENGEKDDKENKENVEVQEV
uniref:Putative sh3 domain-binding glutamic acid-rich n=1 Tax=Tabanus bromius TaxID=304241 RepID=A0A0K8TN16_TABBR